MVWPIIAAIGSLFGAGGAAAGGAAGGASSAGAMASLLGKGGAMANLGLGGFDKLQQPGGLIFDNPLTDPNAALGGAPIPEKPSFLESLFSSSGEQVQLPSIDLGGIQAPHVDAASDLQKLLAFIAASRQKSGGHKRPPQIQTSKYMQSLMGG